MKADTDMLISDALALLDTRLSGLVDGLDEGRFALWAGSGISHGRAPLLPELLQQTLEFVRRHASGSDEYRVALEDLFHAAGLRDRFVDAQLEMPLTDWDPELVGAVLEGLSRHFDIAFSVEVVGQPSDHLLWDGADLVGNFTGKQPDTEHLCIAILLREGAIETIATSNWDDLIETAVAETDPERTFNLCPSVIGSEISGASNDAVLLKFHGCARMAASNPDAYRKRIVASWSQIAGFAGDEANIVIKRSMEQLLSHKDCLFVGLSFSDQDVHSVFVTELARKGRTWPDPFPAVVISQPHLSAQQELAIRAAYSTYNNDKDEILSATHFPGYARALLVALLVENIGRKLTRSLDLGEFTLSASLRSELATQLKWFRDVLVATLGVGEYAGLRRLVATAAQISTVMRFGRIQPSDSLSYAPISHGTVVQMTGDGNLRHGGVPEFAVLLGILGAGAVAGAWSVDFTSSFTTGTISLTDGKRSDELCFVASASSAIALLRENPGANRAVFILPETSKLSQGGRGAEKRRYGRSGKSALRMVGLRDVLESSDDIEMLRIAFGKAAIG